jgi:hypothetical protein
MRSLSSNDPPHFLALCDDILTDVPLEHSKAVDVETTALMPRWLPLWRKRDYAWFEPRF